MKSQEKALRFFLGANTPQGFVSRFDCLSGKTEGWRTLIIKGGPGSGKSTMIKKIVPEIKDDRMELIYCSSDVDSLDAAISPAHRFAIADGTHPHVDVNIILISRQSVDKIRSVFRLTALSSLPGDSPPASSALSDKKYPRIFYRPLNERLV